jgi:polysaccharide export outer membrane protein/exopolysaccharide production protein ExoF
MVNKLIWMSLLLIVISGDPSHAEYRLGPEDNLAVKVYEWPDMSGDFKVGADGIISFPLIGGVSAEGLLTSQLERAVEGMLQQYARSTEPPSVSIQVKEYRPFFIMGDVQRPGAYSFRPGLTVLQAVSIAGGFFRFTDPGLLRLERDAIMQRSDLRILNEKVAMLSVRNARLEAERTGASEIRFPETNELSPTDPKIATIVERESGLFQARKRELEKQLSGLADLQKLYKGEIEAVQSQFQSEKRQAELVQKELDELRGLAARGLAANPRLLLVERTIAEIEGTQRNLEAIVMRARQSIAQAGQQAEELKAKSRERIDAESDTVTAELRDTHARIDMAKQLITEAETTAPVTAARRLRNVGVEPKYQVVRRTATSTGEISLGSSDQLQPGDVVEVRTAPPQGLESEARVADR